MESEDYTASVNVAVHGFISKADYEGRKQYGQKKSYFTRNAFTN